MLWNVFNQFTYPVWFVFTDKYHVKFEEDDVEWFTLLKRMRPTDNIKVGSKVDILYSDGKWHSGKVLDVPSK